MDKTESKEFDFAVGRDEDFFWGEVAVYDADVVELANGDEDVVEDVLLVFVFEDLCFDEGFEIHFHEFVNKVELVVLRFDDGVEGNDERVVGNVELNERFPVRFN